MTRCEPWIMPPALVDQGADLLDIGGESTRPGAQEVSEEQEIHRVLPVVELVRQTSKPISVDTRKVAVARVVLDAGAAIINDVEASRQDDAMWQLVAQTGAGYVAMCSRATSDHGRIRATRTYCRRWTTPLFAAPGANKPGWSQKPTGCSGCWYWIR